MLQNETGTTYGVAHKASTKPDNGCIHQDTVDVIKNLVTAMESDHATITQITSTIARLMTELVIVNKIVFVALQSTRASCGSCTG